jgi:hypothetical protein
MKRCDSRILKVEQRLKKERCGWNGEDHEENRVNERELWRYSPIERPRQRVIPLASLEARV